MAKNSIRDYSNVNSSNTDIQSIDISEGCSPAGINNAIREVMADLKNVSTGAIALETPAADSLTVTGDLTVDTTTLKVDSANNLVGVGVAAPDAKLHVLDTAASTTTHSYTKLHLEDSDHLAMQFSGGTSGEQWIWFSDDTTATPVGGITYYHGGPYMGFRVEGAERLRINSSGNLLVGTTTPNDTERLSVLTATDVAISTRVSSASNFYSLLIRNSSQSTIGSIYSTTTSTAFNTSSDYRLKENVVADWDATTRLKQLKPVRFNFIADADTTVDGFLAHEVQTVVPEAITGEKDAMRDEEYEVTPAVLDDDGNEVTPAVMGTRSVPDYQGIDQSKLVPLLVKTILELEARITALETA